ncbi:TPA: hypothetical protein ACGUOU_004211 [Vibrio vulnificus]|nr:hypothetical protein [Vibrio vulnificus]
MKTSLQQLTFRLLRYLHLIPPDLIMMNEFDLIRGGVEKQLDEYRELLETLELETGYQLRYQCHSTQNQSVPWSHCRPKPSF